MEMRKIIMGKVYDTATADQLLSRSWHTYHPNQGGGSPMCRHERGLYRTKKGALFGYTYDEIGYGRDRDGACGLFTRDTEEIIVFASALDREAQEAEALAWCEEQRFEAEEVEKVLAVEEA